MRWLLALAFVVVGALGVAEVVVPPRIEQAVAERVEAAALGQQDVHVAVSGFPVVARALATGDIQRVVVRLEGVDAGGLVFATVSADVQGTVIARSALLEGEVSFESVDRVLLSGELTAEEITRALPEGVTDLVLSPGQVSVVVAGQELSADVTAADGVLRVSPAGLGAVEVPLPRGDLFPCALGGEVEDGLIRVSCTLEEVPPWLVARATTRISP